MNITINTELFRTLGVVPAVVLAVCQASPDLSAREIAQMLGRDYSRTTTIVKDLKKRGYLQNAKPAPETLQNAKEKEKENEKERKQEKENFPPNNPLYKEKEINKEKAKEKAALCTIAREEENKSEGENLTGVVEVVPTPAPATPNAAGARAEINAVQSLRLVAAHAQAHPALLEQYCMSQGITMDEFLECARRVQADWQVKAVTHLSEYDARQHFYNAMRYVIADYRKTHPREETPAEMVRRIECDVKKSVAVDKQLREMCRGSFIDDLIPD